MSFKDRLQPASFRGVAFNVAASERTGGRVVVSHGFPGRNETVPEDMGGAAREIGFEAYVLGGDYDLDRQRLEAALDQSGPGELVHPTRGRMLVQALGYSVAESVTEQRIARFRLRFERADAAASPLETVDSRQAVASTATAVQDAVAVDFADRFTITGLPDWAVTLSGQPLADAAAQLGAAFPALSGVPELSGLDGLSGLLDAEAAARSGDPVAVLRAGFEAIGVAQQTADGLAAVEVLSRFTVLQAAPASLATAARLQAARSAGVAMATARRLAVTARALAASRRSFSNADAALALRDTLARDLKVEAIAAADAKQDTSARALFDLRAAVLADLTTRGAKLERLAPFAVPPGPALAMAQRLYGDGRRAEELIGFAPVRNPLFHGGTGVALGR